MSGIVSGINYNLLFSSDTTSALDASASILNALYSNSTPSTAVSTGNPLTDLKLAQTNQTADIAREAQDPLVARDIANFTKAIASAKDIGTALASPDVQKVLLTANGLSSYIGDTALVQKALLSNPSDPTSLVNQLGDSTLLSTVQTFNFGTNGLAELQNPKIQATLTSGYTEVKWRQSLDAATPGLSNALAFLGQASSIGNVLDILGNSVNRTVITTALGIPQQIAFQDIPAQEAAISARLDVTKLQDPKFVTSLTDQYLLTMQQQNSQSNSADSTSLISLAVQAGGIVA